ncbi:hypothetical protein [Halorubrum laminariae]|uniref:Uracil-DNA glycosylase-like domain-containing protein n=1 Tax=Halorubrum laminariae TaxID=1433523 RepID=A0ABD6C2Y5_9EURY|nr:hypothetical protein [Halorubrum laminariae]
MEDLRDFNTSLVRDGNLDGVWDVLCGIAETAECDAEEIYYTTLQKDGRFDESEEVIGDGFDPFDLNGRSISAWKPYLQEEIDTVDPALIIVFGEASLRAVVDILSVIEDESADDIPSGETYVLDRYPIIWLNHYSNFNPPAESSLQECIKDELEGIDW